MWSSPIIHKFQFTSHRNPFLGLRNRAATVPPSRERPVWVETCRSIRRSPWEGRQHPSPKPQRKPARKPSASKSGPRGRDPHNPLTDITRRLEVVSAVAVTAEVALRAQNCEQDADIAL